MRRWASYPRAESQGRGAVRKEETARFGWAGAWARVHSRPQDHTITGQPNAPAPKGIPLDSRLAARAAAPRHATHCQRISGRAGVMRRLPELEPQARSSDAAAAAAAAAAASPSWSRIRPSVHLLLTAVGIAGQEAHTTKVTMGAAHLITARGTRPQGLRNDETGESSGVG